MERVQTFALNAYFQFLSTSVVIVKVSKKKHQLKCYLCNATATTRDHVPPVGLFPHPRPKNLITVPACESCNQKNSLHDEYFRLIVATSSPNSAASLSLLHQRILPRMKRRPALITSFMKSLQWAEIKSKKGIYLGRAKAFTPDELRIQAVIEKIIRGLYYHHQKRALPSDHFIEKYYRNPDLTEEFWKAISSLPRRDIGENGSVFSYRYAVDEQVDANSFWFLMFFDNSFFISRTWKIDNLVSALPTANEE
ncbi:MAG: hypothetical protein H0X43_13045 [Nitrosospira sp.]|nr:hypothetical protein [Nitrosospira sp.]